MTHHIVRLPPAQVATGPAIGVAEIDAGQGAEDRLRQLLPTNRVPAHRPLVLLWRTDPLSSPDTISVQRVSRTGQRIDLQVELRRFDGTLHGNTVTVPIVEVDLGALDPGRYQVAIEVIELLFTDLNHPENAGNPSTRDVNFTFVVV